MRGFKVFSKPLLGAAFGVLAMANVTQAQALDEIRIITPNDASCGTYPQHVGTAFGFFEDQGIKVTLLPSSTTLPYVAFLQNGDADIVVLDPPQVFQAIDNGLPIKVIYEAYQYAPETVAVSAESPIKSIRDLKGKTVGLASDRDLITMAIALDTIGESVESYDLTTVVVGSSGPVLATSLRDGTIDAFAGGAADRQGIEAAGVLTRNITPSEVSQNPANVMTVWAPTMEEKRDAIQRFLRAWAMAQNAGPLDLKLTAAACRSRYGEQFENVEIGLRIMNNSIYNTQIRRTKNFGELQPDIWEKVQGPYVKLGEVSKKLDQSTFLDSSFIAGANDYTTDQVKAGMQKWKAANPDLLIP